MHKTILVLLALTLFSVGQAQSRIFVGLPGSTVFVGGVVGSLFGFQVGSYDIGGGFGTRLALESNLGIGEVSLTEGSVDVLLSSGEATTLYGGAGAGYILAGGLDGFYGSGFLGVDFDSATAVSYFIEANPRLYTDSGSSFVAFFLRAGVNFSFGVTSQGAGRVQGTCCIIP